MKNDSENHGTFELDFGNWERNRMYAPEHGKESEMKKMTHKHVDALTHVTKLLKRYLRRAPKDDWYEELEKDVKRLDDIRKCVQHTIVNPTLPFGPVDVTPMFNRLKDEACEVG